MPDGSISVSPSGAPDVVFCSVESDNRDSNLFVDGMSHSLADFQQQ